MTDLTHSDYRLLDALQQDTTLSQIDLAALSGKSRTPIWRLIREAGRDPVERDTLYRRVLRDADDATRLEKCLGTEKLDEVRASCAQGLGRIAAPPSRTPLLELARDRQEDPAVSAAAALARPP